MAVETLPLPDLDTIEQEQVDTEKAHLQALLADSAGDARLTRGAVHDLVVRPLADAMAALRADAFAFRAGASLQLLAENPELATDEAVDVAAGNFRVSRSAGGAAAGTMALVVAELVPLTVPKGAVFVGPAGQRFLSDEAYTAKTSEEAVVDQFDRLLRSRSGGGYVFTIQVTAEEAGAAGMARRGDEFTPEAGLPGVAQAYADEDFAGGLDPESNAELSAALQSGVSARTVSTQPGVEALLRSGEGLADLDAVSLVGMNDAEQQRYHAPVPVAHGGRLDVWVKSQALPQTVPVDVSARLVEKNGDGSGVWTFSLTRAQAAGVYRVLDVSRQQSGSSEDAVFDVDSYTLGVDFGEDDVQPDLVTGADAAFSRYQTMAVTFTDDAQDHTNLAVGDAADYSALTWGMPLVAECQDFLNGPDHLPATTDVLVRAAVPVELALTLQVSRRSGSQTVDEDEVATAVAARAQGLGFVGRLTASELAAAAYDALPDGYVVDKVEIVGTAYRPDGTEVTTTSLEAVEVPDEPELMTTAKTAFFVLDAASVTVNVA